jgi:hypothetical protein
MGVISPVAGVVAMVFALIGLNFLGIFTVIQTGFVILAAVIGVAISMLIKR